MLTQTEINDWLVQRSDLEGVIRDIFTADEDYIDVIYDIAEFNAAFEVDMKNSLPLYITLLEEEVAEFLEELMLEGVTANLIKEITDIAYILEGILSMSPEYGPLPMDIDHPRLMRCINVIEEKIIPIVHVLFSEEELFSAWYQVHRSNMTKLDPVTNKVVRREDGKVLKPDTYRAPNMELVFSPELTLEKMYEELR